MAASLCWAARSWACSAPKARSAAASADEALFWAGCRVASCWSSCARRARSASAWLVSAWPVGMEVTPMLRRAPQPTTIDRSF